MHLDKLLKNENQLEYGLIILLKITVNQNGY